MAQISRADRSCPACVYRRDLDQDQHDAPIRLGKAWKAPHRQDHASWPLEDHDLRRGAEERSHRRALPVRRSDQRRTFPSLCRARTRPHPQVRRHRRSRQSRIPQIQGRPQRGASSRSPPRLPPEILARPQSDRTAFAKLKGELRKAKPRTVDAICDAIRDILTRFSSTESENYLANAGYAPS